MLAPHLILAAILAAILATVPRTYAQGAAEQSREVDQPTAEVEQPAAEVEQPAADVSVPQAVPRGRRARGDHSRAGSAVPRGTRRAHARAPNDRDRADRRRAGPGRPTVVIRPPSVFDTDRDRRRAYPHGYGTFGLGYFYYDRYRWSPGSDLTYKGHSDHGNRWGDGFDVGQLRLQVSPRHAQVFVDGYYAGTVDDYDGAFQSLTLESGPYAIQIVAPGYETLDVDVRIIPGQKITYREDLRERP